MNSPLEHAKALLARAEDDFYVVRRMEEDAGAPTWVIGFHAQQAVEKSLKAVLSGAGQVYPRTHNLVMLAQLLDEARIPMPPDAEEFGALTPFGVVLRYEVTVADEPPAIDISRLDAMISRTLAWAKAQLTGK